MLDKEGVKPLIRRIIKRFSRHGIDEVKIMDNIYAIVEREAPDPDCIDFPIGEDMEDALFEMVQAGELTWHEPTRGVYNGSTPLVYRLAS